MYLNRKNIELINRLKSIWGADRFAQTNSRLNGCYLKHIRLYSTAADKAAKKNYRELYSKKQIIIVLAETAAFETAKSGDVEYDKTTFTLKMSFEKTLDSFKAWFYGC